MRIAAVRIDLATERHHYAGLVPYISPGKRERLERYRLDRDFKPGLLAEILARTMIAEEFGLANRHMRFVTDQFGKPRLEDWPNYHFNLAHSGEWVACVTDIEQTGIDIEQVTEKGAELAGRFFTQKENGYLNGLPREARVRAFYKLWTLKESYMKADGRGMRIGLDSIGFDLREEGGETKIALETELKFRDCHFRLYDCCPGYEMAVCAMRDWFRDRPEVLDEKELLKRFDAVL